MFNLNSNPFALEKQDTDMSRDSVQSPWTFRPTCLRAAHAKITFMDIR